MKWMRCVSRLRSTNNHMKVKQFIKELQKLEPEAMVLVATVDDNGDTEMVEAQIIIDLRSGDAEVSPATQH